MHRDRFNSLLRYLSLTLLAAVAVTPVPARAQFRYLPVDLAYLSQRANVIVQGRVVDVRYEPMPGYSHIPTVRVTLEVQRMLRGAETKRYTFREALLFSRPRTAKSGYLVGEQLLLFLPTPSQYGLSTPVGGEQGRFHIQRDARGNELIANEYNNGGLFKNVHETAAEEGMSLSDEDLRLVRAKGGPVPLDTFISLVKTLTRLPRIQ